jgi:hypothetical protein
MSLPKDSILMGVKLLNILIGLKSLILLNNYEIEYTLSIDDAVEDMVIISKNNG